MGRYSWSNRKTVEQCRCLDILGLNREGCLRGFCISKIEWKNAHGEAINSIGIQASLTQEGLGEDYVRLFHTVTKANTRESENIDYKVPLVSTPCHFGGVRWWFVCPLVTNGRYCGRRVGKLYLPPNGTYFGCRHCYNLTYRSCKEHDSRLSAFMKL